MSIIKAHVDELYRVTRNEGQFFSDPVFGGHMWSPSETPIAGQKELARRALLAREWFYLHGPSDAPPLPINYYEWDELKYKDPLCHLVTQFSKSLSDKGWDMNSHPGFETYARGVIASPLAADMVRKNEAIRKRYPPRELKFIHPGMIWQPYPWASWVRVS